MGRNEVGVGIPDTFGLTEYFVSDVAAEIDGPNVRVICGARRGGEVHWLYSVVMRSDRLAAACNQLSEIASDAKALINLAASRGH